MSDTDDRNLKAGPVARRGLTGRDACGTGSTGMDARLTALMDEGYREMAEENRRLAEEAFPLVSETIMKNIWQEKGEQQE